MIYKFNNGGIVKLQNAGSVPEYGNIEQIAKYNREHGTNFYKMSQVLEHDKQQAQQKSQNKKKSFWEILAGHPESSGEAILNKTIETANNAELPETRSKIYNDTGKAQLATTAGSLLALPMLGEFSTYGLLGGASRLAGGFGGSAVGSYTLGKAGELGDRTFGTTWMKPAGQVIGGFAGWAPGSNIAYKGALNLASKAPNIVRIGATNRFIGDVAGRELEKSVNSTSFVPTHVVSEIEGNKVIPFTPIPQKFVSTVHFDPRVKPLSRPISEAEKMGIPKNERPMYDPEIFQKAKLFAEEYGYPEPKTPTEIKDMYRRHNTFFRTVGDLDRVYFPKNYESLPDEFKSLSLPEQRKFLASRGYPSYFRGYFNNIEGPFSDEFVFVSPSLEENSDYFINNALDNTVKLQRPFSLRDPKKWHIEADWRIHPANSWRERWWPKGRIEIGNASPSREFKVSTKHLIPVDIAKQDDLGTLLPQYFRKRINDAISKDWWERPKWLQEDYNGNYEIDYLGILPEKFNYKQGGILKAQRGTGLAGIPIIGNLAKKAAYKIVTNPDVAYAGGATPKTIVKSLFSKNQEDDNKKFFLYGVERPYRDLGEAYNWQNDIDENGYKNVKSYEGVLNPYGEYLIDSKNKHLVEDNLGKDLLININSEYTDPSTGFISDSTPYFDDVHGYRLKFHKDENGNIVASVSDLYDFGKNYSGGFSNTFEERSGNKNGKRILEMERNALNAVGQPYILTNKYSVRFVDNPEGEELMRVRNLEGEILSNKKSGGVLSAQKGTPGFVNPFTNQLAKFIVNSIPENPNPVKVIKKNQPVKVIKENQPVKVISTGNPVKVIKVNQPVTLIKETYRRDNRPKRLDDVSYKNHAKFVEHGGKTT